MLECANMGLPPLPATTRRGCKVGAEGGSWRWGCPALVLHMGSGWIPVQRIPGRPAICHTWDPHRKVPSEPVCLQLLRWGTPQQEALGIQDGLPLADATTYRSEAGGRWE